MDTQKLLRLADRKGMLIGAICAAPRALHAAGVYLGYKLTSYPLFASELSASYEYIDEEGKDVVVHENKLVTSRGPATAMPFALELVRLLAGEHEASLVAEQLLFK